MSGLVCGRRVKLLLMMAEAQIGASRRPDLLLIQLSANVAGKAVENSPNDWAPGLPRRPGRNS